MTNYKQYSLFAMMYTLTQTKSKMCSYTKPVLNKSRHPPSASHHSGTR